jgi:ABC-type multidrug transport system fused ATPase/permease subunit
MLLLLAYIFPYFLVAVVPIAVFFFSLVKYFSPTQRHIKRLDNVSRGPLFSHLSATLTGMSTIAAFGKGQQFRRAFLLRLTDNSKYGQAARHVRGGGWVSVHVCVCGVCAVCGCCRAYFGFYYLSRWFALRLDNTTTLIILAVALIAVALRDEVDPAQAALTLTYALAMAGMWFGRCLGNFEPGYCQKSGLTWKFSLVGFFQYTTRLSTELEGRFTSAERINQAIKATPQEESDLPMEEVSADWPSQGRIEFDKVVVRYRPDLPPVLHGVSFRYCAMQPALRLRGWGGSVGYRAD